MKKQKTVIMLEDIKENMLGEKHKYLLDENKMFSKLLIQSTGRILHALI